MTDALNGGAGSEPPADWPEREPLLGCRIRGTPPWKDVEARSVRVEIQMLVVFLAVVIPVLLVVLFAAGVRAIVRWVLPAHFGERIGDRFVTAVDRRLAAWLDRLPS